ncbi:MAG: prolyl oligopeptidase family serine peptidase [Caldilineaceae bacterium]|nr:prolyl oligopeptidase family serine peptidase [Caldilineaceae bacterium]
MKQFCLLGILAVLLFLASGCDFFGDSEQADEAANVTNAAATATEVRAIMPTFTATPLPVAAIPTATPLPPTPTPTAQLVLRPTETPTPVTPTMTPTPVTPTLTPTPVTPTPTIISVLTAHGGGLGNTLHMDTVTASEIDGLSGQFYPNSNFVPAQYDVDRYQIYFQTIDENDQPVSVRAELFIPRVDEWAAFPLFVYGSGTTGIGSTCAPLDELTRGRNWGNYRTHMLSYASQGYIAVLPLWQGYDDATRTHPYFVARLEGYLMLDAARAVYQFFDAALAPDTLAQPLDAIFFSGYSQGGHGAFAADQFAPWYAPELSIKGVIGHATAPSVEALLRERPSLAPYIIYAYSTYYGPYVISPENVFLPQWLPNFTQDVTSKCVDEVYQYYPLQAGQIYRPEFLNALFSGQLSAGYPAFKQVLDLNYVGSSINPNTPALLLHGATDPIVTPRTNETFMAQICALGKRVTYRLYPGVDHFVTRQHAFVDTLHWMQEVLNGGTPPSDCAVATTNGG